MSINFFKHQDTPVDSNPTSIATASINGDGYIDVLTANSGNNTVSLLKGNGKGTFAPHIDFSVGLNPNSITTADIDGDGNLDVLTTNFVMGTISYLKGDGTGKFIRQEPDIELGLSPDAMTTADINCDGKPDIVTAGFRGNSGVVSILLSNADGTFSKVYYTVDNTPAAVTTADIDGDGKLDILTANNDAHTINVLKNNGDGTFADKVSYSVGVSPESIAIADIDGDGKLDVLTANAGTIWAIPGKEPTSTISFLKGNGDATFAPQVQYNVSTLPVSIAVADFDDDYNLDVVTANQGAGTLSFLKGNGDGTFAPQVEYRVGDGPRFVTAADVNNDGLPDALTTNYLSNSISVLLSRPWIGYEDTNSDEETLSPTTESLRFELHYEVVDGNEITIPELIG